MDFPTAVLRDLVDLVVGLDLDNLRLDASLVALAGGLLVAVPSYRGLHLSVLDNAHPVTLTAFLPPQAGESIATSLRLPLAALASGFDPESRIVFYATAPGALVDLAADFAYALDLPAVTTGALDGQRSIALDVDLPPVTLESGLRGLREVSAINRAVGLLIEQGHAPELAHAVLRRHAAAAGVEAHVYAARLMGDGGSPPKS